MLVLIKSAINAMISVGGWTRQRLHSIFYFFQNLLMDDVLAHQGIRVVFGESGFRGQKVI